MAARGYHPPVEEYLSAIHELEENGRRVIQARLVERLGHSAPSISEMIHRLVDSGYVEVNDRAISLTPAGLDRANSVIRRHRLAECFLVDFLKIPWAQAHEEASLWEHVISDVVEERLRELMNNPSHCPHGNLIPGWDGEFSHTRLCDIKAQTDVVLQRFSGNQQCSCASLQFLQENGLTPGKKVRVSEVKRDDSVRISFDRKSLRIGADLARSIYVSA